MRVFLIWAAKTSDLDILLRGLKKSHELVYWLGHHLAEVENRPTGAIFHSHKNAAFGLPAAGVDDSKFSPADENIIKQMQHAEFSILTILNNYRQPESLVDCRHFYFQLLKYWLGVLKKYRPDAIIFPVDPHSGFDNVIYELAKIFSIKTLLFSETRVSDRLLFMNDFEKGSDLLHEKIKGNQGKIFSLADLSDDLREYYQKKAVLKDDNQPSYIDFLKKKYSLAYRLSFARIKSAIADGSIINKSISFFFKQNGLALLMRSLKKAISSFKPNLKKEYSKLQAVFDPSEDYIYAPLQAQPERSTSPAGGIFVDQILMIEIISAALPAGWKIYVKEHPMQWIRKGINFTASRPSGYYEQISRIKNVRLIPTKINSYHLIDGAKAVVTVAGAPGWEAITRSKPAIVFGYPWYKDCPEIYNVNGVESCRRALEIIKQGKVFNKQAVINYLKSLDAATIHGYISVSNEKSSKLNYNDNMKNITNLVLSEFEKYSIK